MAVRAATGGWRAVAVAVRAVANRLEVMGVGRKWVPRSGLAHPIQFCASRCGRVLPKSVPARWPSNGHVGTIWVHRGDTSAGPITSNPNGNAPTPHHMTHRLHAWASHRMTPSGDVAAVLLTPWEATGGRSREARGRQKQQTTPATTSTSSIRQLLGAADAQTAHPAATSTAPTHQLLGSANAETTPARAPAAAADRTQRPDATCEGKNG